MVVYTWIIPDESGAAPSDSHLLSTMAHSKEEALQQVEAGISKLGEERAEFVAVVRNWIKTTEPTVSSIEEGIWLLRLSSNLTLRTGGSLS